MVKLIYFLGIIYFLCSLSCTVKSPEFIVRGVQAEQAISFLDEFNKKNKTSEQLKHYIQHLNTSFAPGFSWDKYWSEIKNKKLYKTLTQEELEQLLSLKNKSCEQKNLVAFVDLILEIAKEDDLKILFSEQIYQSQTMCSVLLPHSIIKSIVQFLAKKRSVLEVSLLVKARAKAKEDILNETKLYNNSIIGLKKNTVQNSKEDLSLIGLSSKELAIEGLSVDSSENSSVNSENSTEGSIVNSQTPTVKVIKIVEGELAKNLVVDSQDSSVDSQSSIVNSQNPTEGSQSSIVGSQNPTKDSSVNSQTPTVKVIKSVEGELAKNLAEGSQAPTVKVIKSVEGELAKNLVVDSQSSSVNFENPTEGSQTPTQDSSVDSKSLAEDSQTPTEGSPEEVRDLNIYTSEKPNKKTIVTVNKKVKKVRFIYTEELQKILINEWSKKQNIRVWEDILSTVDRNFWSDIRWINYQNNDLQYLQKTLDMEFSEYGSIKKLDKDILLMFQKNNKMEDMLASISYKKYFSVDTVDWYSLWETIFNVYTTKPLNGNIDALLSLYTFLCNKNGLYFYFKIIEQWSVPHYKKNNISFCTQKNHNKFINQEIIKTKIDPITNKIKPLADNMIYEVFKKHLQLEQPRTLKDLDNLLIVYNKNKRVRSSEDLKYLINYFSQKDWLYIMKVLRNNNDRVTVSKILDMHYQLYGFKNSFLTEDIFAVLLSKDESIADLVNKYGYNKLYLNNSYILNLFWQKLESSQNSDNSTNDNSTKDNSKCNYSYINNIYKVFSKFNKKDLFLETFNFDNCEDFLNNTAKTQWDHISSTVLHTSDEAWSSEKIKTDEVQNKYYFIWWLAQVISFYSSDSVKLQKIKELNATEWNNIITLMLNSLQYDVYKVHQSLFIDTIKYIKLVDHLDIQNSTCKFFTNLTSAKINMIVSQYDPQLIINLIKEVTWDISTKRSNHNPFCKTTKKFNTLLLLLTDSLFKTIKVPTNIYNSQNMHQNTKYINNVLNQSQQIINLFTQVKGVYKNSFVYKIQKLGNSMLGIFNYNVVDGNINRQSFQFYFSALVMRKLQQVDYDPKELLTLINNNYSKQKKHSLSIMYKEWITDFINNTDELQNGNKKQWEIQFNLLKQKLEL